MKEKRHHNTNTDKGGAVVIIDIKKILTERTDKNMIDRTIRRDVTIESIKKENVLSKKITDGLK